MRSHSPRKSWDYALIPQYVLVSGTVEPHTLTEDELAKHNHSPTQSGGQESPYTHIALGNPGNPDGYKTLAYSGNSVSHTHTITNVTSNYVENIPLYYSISYIMRIM